MCENGIECFWAWYGSCCCWIWCSDNCCCDLIFLPHAFSRTRSKLGPSDDSSLDNSYFSPSVQYGLASSLLLWEYVWPAKAAGGNLVSYLAALRSQYLLLLNTRSQQTVN